MDEITQLLNKKKFKKFKSENGCDGMRGIATQTILLSKGKT